MSDNADHTDHAQQVIKLEPRGLALAERGRDSLGEVEAMLRVVATVLSRADDLDPFVVLNQAIAKLRVAADQVDDGLCQARKDAKP